jgi:hypothetical protein
MQKDSRQYTTLAGRPEYQPEVARLKVTLADKLKAVRANDLETTR